MRAAAPRRRPSGRWRGVLAGAGIGVAAACSVEPPTADSRAGAPALRFVEVGAAGGVTLPNVSGDPHEKRAIPETLGQGAAALDYDGDGRLDLFIANGDAFPGTPLAVAPRPALYRNLGGWRFEDVTERAGLHFRAWAHGASRVDFDADGRDDLYVTVGRGRNRFFQNRGDGRFEDVSTHWGGDDPGPSTAAAFFDADGDGDLDLYVGNYVDYDPDDPPNGGRPCEWRGLAVLCGPKGTRPLADSFWENRDGRLVEAAEAFGFSRVAPSYALGVVAGDLDDDGDVDVYVANDSEPNYLFENLGSGRFREVGALRGADRNEDGRAQAGMGVDLQDVDNDGLADLFVTNFSHDTNTLYRLLRAPTGEPLFEDATNAMGLGLASYRSLGWGTRLVDLDRNGWLDLVVACGHVYPEVDRAPVGTSYRQRNQIFLNRGRGPAGAVAFEEFVPGAGDALLAEQSSRGLVLADLDDDGDGDFLVVEMDAPPSLIRNDSRVAGHWIGFRLRGAGANRDAIGARVLIEDARGVTRVRQQLGGGSYLSTGDPRIDVGLGPADGPLSRVEVRWPSGATTVHRDLAPQRYWTLDEERGTAEPGP
jgi:hypothetical protein